MKYVLIRTYLNGKFTTCEHLYPGTSHVKAIEQFLAEYPEHKICTIVARDYDSDDEKNKYHFYACKIANCVH